MITSSHLRIEPEIISKKINDFIVYTIKNSHLNSAVIAVSGGIDSAVSLVTTVKALGRKNVLALTLPERDITPQQDLNDVIHLCEMLDVTCEQIEITPILDVMKKNITRFDPSKKVAFGNMKARTRMLLTYYYANLMNALVIGTGNKTELYLGYYTKYGDGGVDVMPFADLYKCQMRQLGRYLGIPASITEKPASARLWAGQLTENELGIPYDTLDLIVYAWSQGLSPPLISKEVGCDEETTRQVVSRIYANEHKRTLPLILRLS